MTIDEFLAQFPHHRLIYGVPVVEQRRLYDEHELCDYPPELSAQFETPVQGGRGKSRWNFNNTRTHYQCKVCQRVRRHDFFWSSKDQRRDNMLNPTCKECAQPINATNYQDRAETLTGRRLAVWRYLAPACAICGFDKHPALDMHHLKDKEVLVAHLITDFCAGLNISKAEKLLREAKKCMPLCGNCHRLLHAGVVELPAGWSAPKYNLATLLQIARPLDESYQLPMAYSPAH